MGARFAHSGVERATALREARVPPEESPRAIRLVLEALPRNALGKVTKPDLVKRFETEGGNELR